MEAGRFGKNLSTSNNKYLRNKVIKNIRFANEFWALIPARSGSKKIKNKNICRINGIPLVMHSLLFASKIKNIKKIIFSSDSSKYLKFANRLKKIFKHKRKHKAAHDNSTDLEVFKDFLEHHLKSSNILPKYFIYLRPTSPIRKTKTVIKAIKTFKKVSNKYSSLCSVNLMSETAFKSTIIINKKLYGAYKKVSLDSINLPRQKLPKTYKFNGIIDIFKTKNIIQNKLYGNKTYPFDTGVDFNIEIDTKNDLRKVKNYFL